MLWPFPLRFISGAITVTVCVQVAVLPGTSVAVQMTVLLPMANEAGALLPVTVEPQLSLAIGGPRATPEAVQRPASGVTVTADGQVITGACDSVTVTVNVQVAVLLPMSVMTNVLTVVPTANWSPLGCPVVW